MASSPASSAIKFSKSSWRPLEASHEMRTLFLATRMLISGLRDYLHEPQNSADWADAERWLLDTKADETVRLSIAWALYVTHIKNADWFGFAAAGFSEPVKAVVEGGSENMEACANFLNVFKGELALWLKNSSTSRTRD